MIDTCKTSDPGVNGRFAFLNRASLTRCAPIPLRLIVGYGFMQHGYAKLAKGPEAFALILHAIGVPAPHFMAWLTILIELFGGLAVLLGAFIPLASLPTAGVLLVAMFSVHLPYGFSSIKIVSVVSGRAQFGPPGYECDLLYLGCLAALVLGGRAHWRSTAISRGKAGSVTLRDRRTHHRSSARDLACQSCHEANEIAPVIQPFIIDRSIAG